MMTGPEQAEKPPICKSSQITNQVLSILTKRALAEIRKKGLDHYKAQFEGEVDKRLDSEKEKLGDKLKGVLGY